MYNSLYQLHRYEAACFVFGAIMASLLDHREIFLRPTKGYLSLSPTDSCFSSRGIRSGARADLGNGSLSSLSISS